MILYGGQGGPLKKADDGSNRALKKGPWTAAEDQVLAAYVREYGEGNWNAVQKNTGLNRCGKSCRLRWYNHLRPNLRKGSITPEEERLIIRLHAHLGNKWARMASQLPGRTDNEIKNFWNTRLKRLQRQNLPVYPPDIVPTYEIQPQYHHQQQQQQQMYIHQSLQAAPSYSRFYSSAPATPSATAAVVAGNPSPFTFQTTTQLYQHSPTPCPSPTTPHPLSPTSPAHRYQTLPLFTVPTSSTTATTMSPPATNLNNDNVFSFTRQTPILTQPSLRFKRFGNNTNGSNIISTNANTNRDGFLSSFSSPATPSGSTAFNNASSSNSWNPTTSFLTLPNSSPATPSESTAFNDASSSGLLQTQYNNSFQCSNGVTPVYLDTIEFPSNQNSQPTRMDSFERPVTNDFLYANQGGNPTNPGNCKSDCRLLEEMLKATEGMVGICEPKRKQALDQPGENNITSQNLNEEESVRINATKQDNWCSNSLELSNGQSSDVADDNLMLNVHNLASWFPSE